MTNNNVVTVLPRPNKELGLVQGSRDFAHSLDQSDIDFARNLCM